MKVKINAIEKCVFEVILDAPEGMSDTEFKNIIAKVEAQSNSMTELANTLEEEYGFTTLNKSVRPAYSIENEFKINYMETHKGS